MRVCIVGAGYVGVVTAASLAELGHVVTCVDVDRHKVDLVLRGRAPVFERGLEELVSRHAGARLTATTDLGAAVSECELSMIAVGTPSTARGIDLSAVVTAATEIGRALAGRTDRHTVVVKSTVVPGTTDGVVLPAVEEASGKRAGSDFGVGMNPEFLTEGQAVSDFMAPDRIVLGALDEQTRRVLDELYVGFPSTVPRVHVNTRTAEMIKYASNALLATAISFANEIGNLGAAVGDVDVVDVMHGVHLSRYLTLQLPDGERVRAPLSAYLEAGCGFGGSCLPKDVRALIAEGDRLGRPMAVLRAVLETNERQPMELVRLVEGTLGALAGREIGVLGLAFKPDTDDTRESPTVPVVRGLLERGASVTVHDPVVRELPVELRRDGVVLLSDLDEVVRTAEALVLVTRWEEYRRLPVLLAELEAPPRLIDGRRLLAKTSLDSYVGIGEG